MNRLSICLTAFILICSCLLPLNAGAQWIDFSDRRFEEPVDVEYWKRNLRPGIEIDSSIEGYPRVLFHSPVRFARDTFHSRVVLRLAQFASGADFEGAQFYSSVDLWSARFDRFAVFAEVAFGSLVDFSWAKFPGVALFHGATLPSKLDFRHVTDIGQEIDFTQCRPPREGGKCHIALVGADISKVRLSMRHFELWFPDDPTPTYEERLSVYESVLQKLKDDGYMDSHQILDIEYRKFKFRSKGNVYWYITDTLQRWWWNYGYNPERIFVWAFGLWLCFSLVNVGLYRKLNKEVYTIEFLDTMHYYFLHGVRKRMIYALEVVTYTAIVFFGLKLDLRKFKKGAIKRHPCLFVYLMKVYVLGLLIYVISVNVIATR